MIYLANAFSANMLDLNKMQIVTFVPLSLQEVKRKLDDDFVSVVGHEDLANILTNIIGKKVQYNRATIKLTRDDVLILAQFVGERLPPGTIELPEGAEIKFVKVEIF